MLQLGRSEFSASPFDSCRSWADRGCQATNLAARRNPLENFTRKSCHSRYRLYRLLGVFLLVVSGAIGATIAVAAPASAACPGGLGFRQATSTGELVVYYSTASGGTNCAQTNHLGSAYGVTSLTEVGIVKCTQSAAPCIYAGAPASDTGYYAYYAGPVSVFSTNGKCIYAYGYNASISYNTITPVLCG